MNFILLSVAALAFESNLPAYIGLLLFIPLPMAYLNTIGKELRLGRVCGPQRTGSVNVLPWGIKSPYSRLTY